MTALGVDISEHNPGLIIPTDGSVDYVIARASLAETKKDSLYHTFRDQCRSAKIPFAAYHFVYPRLPGSTYAAQASNFHSVVGDTSVPVMLDVETDNTTHPSLADAVGVRRALVAIGYRVPLIYLPRWYWNGALASAPIPAELGDLMSSNYGSNTPHLLADGYRTRGGDTGPGWTPYGGRPVGIWQFTSNALVGGQSIDGGACREPLSTYFTLWGATGDDMSDADVAAVNAHTDQQLQLLWQALGGADNSVFSGGVTAKDAQGRVEQLLGLLWQAISGADNSVYSGGVTAKDLQSAITDLATKATVSDTSASVLAAVSTLAAKVTDLQDAVAQIQTAAGGGPATITLTGTSTPAVP